MQACTARTHFLENYFKKPDVSPQPAFSQLWTCALFEMLWNKLLVVMVLQHSSVEIPTLAYYNRYLA